MMRSTSNGGLPDIDFARTRPYGPPASQAGGFEELGDLTAWKAAAGRFRRTGLWLGRWRTCQFCGRVLLPDTAAENRQEDLQGQPS